MMYLIRITEITRDICAKPARKGLCVEQANYSSSMSNTETEKRESLTEADVRGDID